MTWWLSEDKPEPVSTGTRARQRWDQLRSGTLEVVGEPPVGAHLACRFIMSGWQVWRRIDREWCEYVCDAVSREDALRIVDESPRPL